MGLSMVFLWGKWRMLELWHWLGFSVNPDDFISSMEIPVATIKSLKDRRQPEQETYHPVLGDLHFFAVAGFLVDQDGKLLYDFCHNTECKSSGRTG